MHDTTFIRHKEGQKSNIFSVREIGNNNREIWGHVASVDQLIDIDVVILLGTENFNFIVSVLRQRNNECDLR